ncbi:MAG: ATP-dependent Clp protease proteolytic subunit [Thermaerobacter sp.]|nr:ATP-dependent Clp protease proteolytic subunit [Thermaerobacter sp.]
MGLYLLQISGTIEGHISLAAAQPGLKSTAYERVFAELVGCAMHRDEVDCVLVLIHTVGGDADAGLAIAEAIASVNVPTASVVLGTAHSAGFPIAVAAQRTFIAPSAVMLTHPVAVMGETVISPLTLADGQRYHNRMADFISRRTGVAASTVTDLMMATGKVAGGLGTMLSADEAVSQRFIQAVGGITQALGALEIGKEA